MLIEFRVQNHRSLREEQVLTLEAAYRGDEDDPRARIRAEHPEAILTAAALYGANASGKSNVIEALAFMQEVVLYSHRMWEPEGGVPRDPFAWGGDSSEPSTFEITFISEGTRYRYGFAADDERIVEEWLHAWPKKRQQTWFTRDGDEFKYGDNLKGENRLVEQVTRPNALFLSSAVQHRHEQLRPVYHWFWSLSVLNMMGHRRSPMTRALERWLPRFLSRSPERQQSLFSDDGPDPLDQRETFLTLLRAADVGIVDLKVEDDADERRPGRSRPRILLRHQHHSSEAWLPLEQESHGTRTLLRLAPPLLQALRLGSVIAIDELDANLHPLLAENVVRQFSSPSTNPRNAQLVFTTHNTNLLGTTLGEPVLRRDQIWLTEKDPNGATSLSPLSDYKPRKAENMERGYLQGRYGAVPILGDLGVPPE